MKDTVETKGELGNWNINLYVQVRNNAVLQIKTLYAYSFNMYCLIGYRA